MKITIFTHEGKFTSCTRREPIADQLERKRAITAGQLLTEDSMKCFYRHGQFVSRLSKSAWHAIWNPDQNVSRSYGTHYISCDCVTVNQESTDRIAHKCDRKLL